MTRATCPHCARLLEYDYCIESWYEDSADNYCERWSGYCERCDREYQWTEVYTKTTIRNLKEEQA